MSAAHRYVAYTSDIGESFRPVAHPVLIRSAYGISWLYLTGDVLHEGYKAYIANQAMLRGGQKISDTPDFLRPKESSTVTTTTKVSSLSETQNGGEDGLRDGGKNLLKPVGKVGFLEDYRTVMVQRAAFQGLASMGLPALTIHSVHFPSPPIGNNLILIVLQVVRYSGRALRNNKNVLIRTWGPVGLGLAVVPALPYIFDHPVETSIEWVFEKSYETITGKKGVHEKEL